MRASRDTTGSARTGPAPAQTQTTGNPRLVREYLAYLQVEKGLRPATCEAYARDLDQFAEQVERRDALLLTAAEADLKDFMARLRANHVDARSVARKLSCLRGFYRWLLLDKRIAHDPTVTIETPASWKVLPKSLAESEVAAMLDRSAATAAAPATENAARNAASLALRDHAILELLYAGGLRVGEIVALREQDLHLDQARAQVRGKGDKERIVPLGRRAVEALEAYVTRARPALAARQGREVSPTRSFSPPAAAPSPASGSGRWSAPPAAPPTAAPVARARTCSATAAPPTWSSTAPTCAACSASSVTPTSRLRRSTPTSPWSTSSASTATTTPAETEDSCE
jgi:site-specific recombinase XerD